MTSDYLIDKFSTQHNFFRFNTDRFYDYEIKISADGTIVEYKDKSMAINLTDCDALYYRKITLPSLEDYEPRFRELMYREMMSVIEGIAETAGKRAVTRPSSLRRADNKIVQLKEAKKVGFILPLSLITNSDASAQSFCSEHQSIIKPISYGKIVDDAKIGFIQTNLVKQAEDIEGLSCSPAYFQSYENKDYEIRLTIVKHKLFGVRIDSTNKVDWRKEGTALTYSKIEIPSHIGQKCLMMMENLGINFAAFDFIVHNDEYFFLELNANGQWLWLEEQLDLDISSAIMKQLSGEANE